MRIGTGQDTILAQPFGPSGLCRRSPHDGWVRFAVPAADSQAGSPRRTPGRRSYPRSDIRQENALDCRSRGQYFLLTPRAFPMNCLSERATDDWPFLMRSAC